MFLKIDLQSGCHELRIKVEDLQKTTFKMRYGHYVFLVTPLGLTNTTATFMYLKNRVFRPYLDQFVIVFIDDILIYSRFREKHEMHLQIALQTLREHHLYAKLSKYQLWLYKIVFLGHVVSSASISVDPSEVEAILKSERLRLTSEIWSFQGLPGYYQWFIQGYSFIASTLKRLTRKEEHFMQTNACEHNFDTLKGQLTSALVLSLPKGNNDFVVYNYTSDIRLGYILMQWGKMIAYSPWQLKVHE